MKLVCPNNPKHKRFSTYAAISREWIVDEDGKFIREGKNSDIINYPDEHDCFWCVECATEADKIKADEK